MNEEIRGPFSAVVGGVVDAIEHHDRLPPHRKPVAAACLATEILFWCYWLAPFFAHQSGTPFEVWAGITGAAGLGLLAAAWASRGMPRDFDAMFWSLVFGGGFGALLYWHVYPYEWGPVAVYFFAGFYWSSVAVSAVRFVLASQLLSGGGGEAGNG